MVAILTANDIVSDALRYSGARYAFGGTPGTTAGHDNGTDCSGFANMVVGRDLGLAIPGYAAGTYHGQVHGPVVLQWAAWSGASTLPKGQAPSPGDLCVWPGAGAGGHMGIATSSTHMISALDTAQGTLVTPIQGYGPPGVTVVYRRIVGVGAAVAGGSTSGAGVLVPILAGAALSLGLIAAVIGAAAIIGTAAAAVIGAAISRGRHA